MEGLFQTEIGHGEPPPLDFAGLLDRLKDLLLRKIRNGELTERGLARRVGLSQSHIHNVLNGARVLTPTTADRLLAGLEVSVLELIEREEAEAYWVARSRYR